MPAYFASAFSTLDATILAAFGEGCTFHPAAGGSRAITAAVDAGKVTVQTESGLWEEYRLEAFVMLDPDNALYGGIDKTIKHGDGLRRDSDPDGHLYAFEGECVEESESAWKLAFTRRIPFERGGNRIQ